MDSLDAVPSAEYASLQTIAPLQERTGISKDELICPSNNDNKFIQEHIYDQVTPTEPPETNKTVAQRTKTDLKLSKFDKPKNNSIYDTYVLRKPTVHFSQVNTVLKVTQATNTDPNLLPKKTRSHKPEKSKTRSLNAEEAETQFMGNPLESNADPSVFSISGRRVIVSEGIKGTLQKSSEIGRQNQVSSNPNTSPSPWSRSPTEDIQLEKKRKKLQVCSDCFSLCLFVPGTLICLLSPILLVPIYLIPNFAGGYLNIAVWVMCLSSSIFVFIGCIVGNMVWYRKDQKWKCFLHCGKGPKGHYWGESFSERTLHVV